MDQNTRNTYIAVGLSLAIIVLWQIFYVSPKLREEEERRRAAAEAAQQAQIERGVQQPSGTGVPQPGGAPAVTPQSAPGGAPQPTAPAPADASTGTIPPQPAPGATTASAPPAPAIGQGINRDAILARAPRIPIRTDVLSGSISLKGGRIDDLTLLKHRTAVEDDAPKVTLLSPAGSQAPFYAEYGWSKVGNDPTRVPTAETVWSVVGNDTLTPETPLTLEWDNGAGITFRRIISLDENYMFSVRQEFRNNSGGPVTLYPYGLISRHGTPPTAGIFVIHEGLIGVLGEEGLQEVDYGDAISDPQRFQNTQGGWLGITDKYWATVLIPDQQTAFTGQMSGTERLGTQFYQTDYLGGPVTAQAGGTGSVTGNLFAGAKRVTLVDDYETQLGIEKFELLIDWGWFYFITKPLIYAIDFFFKLFGNFGVSILIVTVLVKLLFFPLANKAYKSMSRMKELQPQLKKLQDRYKDDRVKLQQEMMALYKKEQINPMSGCLPVLIQIPVFFALYKVLFVSLEMRHAPFFGWIQDLSAKDPTSMFNLFGLLPYSVPDFLVIGIWPIIMGVTMLIQMKLNPAPTDPIQAQIFAWMPILFTFLLATFPAGLVIYWTWNNILSVAQQYYIMTREGVKVELWENIKKDFSWVKPMVSRIMPSSSSSSSS